MLLRANGLFVSHQRNSIYSCTSRVGALMGIQTVFQFIDLCDEIEFTLSDTEQVNLVGDLPGVETPNNLVYRAAMALRAYTDCRQGVSIAIRKKLPMGAGLGGGSSNAATTLVALNTLWSLNLNQQQLIELGVKLGADVPVFIHGRACWAEGTGGDFSPIELQEPWYLVLRPDVVVPTAQMFAVPELTRQCSPITIRDFLAGQGLNVFEPVVSARYPAVSQALAWLHQQAETGRIAMSGTGSCVFMACETEDQALDLLQKKPANLQGWVTQGRNVSPLFVLS